MIVLLSEVVVDWLKHAFITKFNHIRPSVYERYMDVFCHDLASGSAVGRRGARKVINLVSLNQLVIDCSSALLCGSVSPSRTSAWICFATRVSPGSHHWLPVSDTHPRNTLEQLRCTSHATRDAKFQMDCFGPFVLALVCCFTVVLTPAFMKC